PVNHRASRQLVEGDAVDLPNIVRTGRSSGTLGLCACPRTVRTVEVSQTFSNDILHGLLFIGRADRHEATVELDAATLEFLVVRPAQTHGEFQSVRNSVVVDFAKDCL